MDAKKSLHLILEDKENNGTEVNKVRTPNNKVSKKEKKSPLALLKPGKDLSNNKYRKIEGECLTPKGRKTIKEKVNISNLKQKSDIIVKKEKDCDNSSTVKKTFRQTSQLFGKEYHNQY